MSATTIDVSAALQSALILSAGVDSRFYLRAVFTDIDGNLTDLDSAPTLTVTSAFDMVERLSGATMSGPTTTGIYQYTLDIGTWPEALYKVVSSGQMAGVAVRLQGAFNVYSPTAEQTLILRVRKRLFDIQPELYALDLPVPKVTDDQVYGELLNGLIAINEGGVYHTTHTFATCPRHDLLIQYAWAKILQGFAVAENWNQFSMNDGSVNLTINRAQLFQNMGQSAEDGFRRDVETWKKSLRPRMRGAGTPLYPFQVRRALSFLPNMQQVFGP